MRSRDFERGFRMRMSGMFGLAILIIACGTGCSTTQQTVKHLTPDERPDTTLTAELKKEFASDAVLKRTKVIIAVNNGEVDLTGTVVSEAEKRRADEVAKSFKGVRWVKNEIIVTQADNL